MRLFENQVGQRPNATRDWRLTQLVQAHDWQLN